ncbi:MAG: ATP-binding protein, partial [Polyangiaceae bacterium]|nr:ATP-binding protein [Polyangiaceae bacterium]
RAVRLESLFHRRQMRDEGAVIRLGPTAQPEATLTIRPVRLYRRSTDQASAGDWQLYEPEVPGGAPGVEVAHVFGLAISHGGSGERLMAPEPVADVIFQLPLPGLMPESESKQNESSFIPAAGLAPWVLSSWWDSVTLTDAEDRVAECLRIVAPVQRISLVERPADGGRMVMVKLNGEAEPVPLRSLGDGVRKMFGFALGLEAARASGVLLIDEIENGIHYSVHEALWRFIIAAARRSDVQVFATTHSWDCVMGFQAAAAADPTVDVSSIRLYRREKDDIDAVVLDREDISVATRDQIDFR